jgi:hypothetical protein
MSRRYLCRRTHWFVSAIPTFLIWLAIVLFNVLAGGWSVAYLLSIFLAKTIPFWGACLIGLFTAEITVPVAIVTWLLKAFGVL